MLHRPLAAPRHRMLFAALALLALAGAAPAAADWLVTRAGAMVQTRGPWKVEGERVLYTDIHGAAASLRAAEVDLTASTATSAAVKAVPASESKPRVAPTDPDQVILYATSWCGYCRKTRALFKELGVTYTEKDIETSAEGRDEYKAKGHGYDGVPLIDFGGKILRGYDEGLIRAEIAAMREKAAKTAGASRR